MSTSDLPDPSSKAAMDKLLNVYLDGMASGALSTLARLAPHLPESLGDSYAKDMVLSIRRDPLAMEMILREVNETLLGQDTGIKRMRVFRNGGRS